MKNKRTGIFLLIHLLVIAMPINAQEWNQWRGALRNGVVSDFSAPANWATPLKQIWKTPVGSGYSSPVVAQSKIYLHTRRDEQEVVSCIDLTSGKIVWSQSYAAQFAKNQYAARMGKGPNSTPLIYAGKLYTLGVTAILSCFDARSGKLKWRKDYSPFVDTSKLFCGTAMSPVVDKDKVIVHVGDDRKGWVVAFDAESGKEKWKWEGDGPGYASPIIVDLEGTRQFVTLTDKSVIGIAADSGKLLWKFAHADEWNENIITPVWYQKSLIISGVRQGTRAIKIAKTGENWAASELWHNPKVAMYMSSPVLDGDYLYGLSTLKKGQFFCVNAQTGEALWMTEGRNANNATVVAARNFLFLLTDDAELIVAAKGSKGFEQLARYTVADSPTWSHPLIFGKQLLIKDEKNLTLWRFQ
ncbi:MAG: PQQ-binding-like beta-propeller repeat protein [Acidobacteriota bacterium]